jgi:hypothetical protein
MPGLPPTPPSWHTLYTTGFEESEGFVAGPVNAQQDWVASNAGPASSAIGSAAPAMDGAQWLTQDVFGSAGTRTTSARYPFPGVAGRMYRVHASLNTPSGLAEASKDARVLLGLSSVSAYAQLTADGSISVFDAAGTTLLVATWTPGVRQNLVLTVAADRLSWTLEINGVLVHTGVPVNVEPDFATFRLFKSGGALAAYDMNTDGVLIQSFG